MRILDRYLLREFFYSFGLTLVSLLGIYSIVEFFEKIDDVVKRGIGPAMVMRYLFYSIPRISFQMLPVAFLLAVMLALGGMSRRGELMAIKACGVSLHRCTFILIVMALIFSSLALISQEVILPESNQLAYYYEKIIEGKKPGRNLRQNQIWFWGSKNRLFNIQFMDDKHQEIHGVTIFDLDSEFNLIHRVDAKRGVYQQGTWYLYDGIERTFRSEGWTHVSFHQFKEEIFPIPERFEDIFTLQKQPEEMSYDEFHKYIRRLKAEGYKIDKYLVDLHTKIARPFITFIMALLGVSFPVKIDKSAKLFNIGLGMLISFIYWIIFYISISLGYIGLLPPMLSAWIGNLAFLILGIYLFITIPT